jgi:hypothetical protein
MFEKNGGANKKKHPRIIIRIGLLQLRNLQKRFKYSICATPYRSSYNKKYNFFLALLGIAKRKKTIKDLAFVIFAQTERSC